MCRLVISATTLLNPNFYSDADYDPFHSWEHVFYPLYYIPINDVDEIYFEHAGGDTEADTYDIVVNDRRSAGAAQLFKHGDLKGWLKIGFDKVDSWFEEDEEIFVHPKDPYKVRQLCLRLDHSTDTRCLAYGRTAVIARGPRRD